MKTLKKPEDEMTRPVDLWLCRRSRGLTPAERQALADLNKRFDAGHKAWPAQIRAALKQLLQWRIVRMLLAESLLLALLGGTAAAMLSFWATDLLGYALSVIVNGLGVDSSPDWNFSPDWRVFGATLLISLLVGVFCGMAPALQASKADLTAAMKAEAGLLSPRFRHLSWRNALVVAQVAGTFVLLAGSGLFLRSARQALQTDLGFETQNLAFNRISFSSTPHPALQDVQFFHELKSRVAALPEVESVCLAEGSLLDGDGNRNRHKLRVDDTGQMPFGEREIESFVISPNYFATVGIPLMRGRDFAEGDLASSSRVVIINEALARRAFPGQSPLGWQVRLLTGLILEKSAIYKLSAAAAGSHRTDIHRTYSADAPSDMD
jgi:hypothetical protein